jgi:hypothetical protein
MRPSVGVTSISRQTHESKPPRRLHAPGFLSIIVIFGRKKFVLNACQYVVRLDPEPRVNSFAKGSGSDPKAGSQVSIQAKSGQSGDLIATQIVMFAPGSNRPDAEPGPDNAPLVATIKKTNASPEGPVLTVAGKDGDGKTTTGPDTRFGLHGQHVLPTSRSARRSR